MLHIIAIRTTPLLQHSTTGILTRQSNILGGGDLQQWEGHWAWHWCPPLTQGGAPQLPSFAAPILLTNWTCFLGSPNFKLGQSCVPTTGHGMKASAQPPSGFCFRARGFAASKEGLEKTPGSDVVLLWNTPVWKGGEEFPAGQQL